jgi:hypothetical protein
VELACEESTLFEEAEAILRPRLGILVPEADHPEHTVLAAGEIGFQMQGLDPLRDFSPLFAQHRFIQFVCESAHLERAFFIFAAFLWFSTPPNASIPK